MEFELPINAQIYLLLLTKIHINNICKKIIFMKKKLEIEESILYHTERWETISSKYFRSFERLHHYSTNIEYDYWNKFRLYKEVTNSNDIDFIYEPDKTLNFFNETNTPYQVRGLLMDILSIPICNPSILNNDFKKYRRSKDIPFGCLSKLIFKSIKGSNR